MRDTHTPPRSVRVPDELWEALKAKAAAQERTVTDVLLAAIRRYLARP